MTARDRNLRPDSDSILFVPLGGTGEIGMNLYLYGHAGKWLMVDLGVTFADETMPGVEILTPDPAFIAERKNDLVGLVLTHGHEDHIGAIPLLWPELRCPVYATPFTAELLRHKLNERGLEKQVPIHVVPVSGRFQLDPFDLEFVTLTHSIPEPNGLVIRTKAGTVLHSGDWKFDPNPLVGDVSDVEALKRLGDDGVLALVCDSTNALEPGTSGSEADVREGLTKLFGELRGRIAIACFATNVARLETIALAAAANDRQVALVGRSLWRINEVARKTGYLKDVPEFLTEADAGYVPSDKIVLICTGSQGEPRSALSRIAADEHQQITLERGDTAIFSARAIPGNEKSVGRVHNLLTKLGVRIITADDRLVHVSGHPYRDELARMYQLVRPQVAIPMHGEYRHLAAHAELARSCQVKEAVIPEDGAVLRISSKGVETIDHVPVGRLALDGGRLVPIDQGPVRSRQRIMHAGAVVATLVLDRVGRLMQPPKLTALGLIDGLEEPEIVQSLETNVRDALDDLTRADRHDDDAVKEAARLAVRRTFHAALGRKPITEIHVVRL